MKKEIWLVILILILPFGISLDNKIYSGWVSDGIPFSIGNDTFVANYLLETNATVIMLPEGISAVIYASSMNCTQEWLYTICQEKQRFRIKGADVPPDVRSNELNVSLFLKINKTDAGLDISNDFKLMQVFLGDIIDIKMTLGKIGQPEVRNVSFIESYPGFSVESLSEECTGAGDKINFKTASFDKKIVCLYRLIPQKTGVFNSSASVSYVVLDKKSSKVTSKSITVLESPVEIKAKYNGSVKVNNDLQIGITPNINRNSEMRSLSISFPPPVVLANYSAGFSRNINEIKLTNPKNISYVAIIQSPFSGNFTFNVSVIYEHAGLSFEIKKSFALDFLPALPTIALYGTENASVLRISNTENVSFKNIKIYAGDSVFDVPLLEKNRYKEFTASPVKNETKVTAIFESESGQKFSEDYLLSYSLAPSASLVNLTVGSNKSNATINFSSMKIPDNAIIFGAVMLFIGFLFIFIKLRNGKSELDKEIDEIRRNNFK